MPPESTEERVRSGAKSCAECRRRKIRCMYSSNSSVRRDNGRTPCENCKNHGRSCLPQLQRPEALRNGRMTARERISRLEQNMNSLVELLNEKSAATSISRPSTEEDQLDRTVDEVYAGFEVSETEHTTLPSHLRLLFDDFIDESSTAGGQAPENSQSARILKASIQNARSKLQPLLPSREEVTRISLNASDWMDLYYALFPPSFAFHTADQLKTRYDEMQNSEVSPITLSMYLLSIAITALQSPPSSMPRKFYNGRGVSKYVDIVCRTVEHTVVNNNALASTVDALEMSLLYVRLSMGRGNLKGTWLIHRRLIALAETMGLPQANQELAGAVRTEAEHENLKQRANVWEAICATDRNFSLMSSFPAGTARYRFPYDNSIMRDGVVSPNAYNYQLSNICVAVFEIDESYLRGASPAESYEKVLSADRQLRALGASAPKVWWGDSEDEPLANLLVKFWHHYFLARVHLRPGLISDSGEQYPYSRSTCQDACRNAVRRFSYFRRRVPSGFFVCRVLDVQAFTAATFLLLSDRSQKSDGYGEHSQMGVDVQTVALVQQVIDCFATARDKPGSDLAREAEVALSSLLAFVQGDGSSSQPLRLQIPLLGRIQISRARFSTRGQWDSTHATADTAAPMEMTESYQNVASDFDSVFDPILWSFEFSNPSSWMAGIDPLDTLGIDNWRSDGSVGQIDS